MPIYLKWYELENPARKINKIRFIKLKKDYAFTWYVKNNALEKTQQKALRDFYTQNTRKKIYTEPLLTTKTKISIRKHLLLNIFRIRILLSEMGNKLFYR
jgi:hypothetical protein